MRGLRHGPSKADEEQNCLRNRSEEANAYESGAEIEVTSGKGQDSATPPGVDSKRRAPGAAPSDKAEPDAESDEALFEQNPGVLVLHADGAMNTELEEGWQAGASASKAIAHR